jgi:hypothetical protein
MKHLNIVVVLLALAACAARAAEGPEDFAARLEIEAPTGAPLLQLTLPADVYRAARRADLGDVRIFNAAGEAVPMAFAPRAAETAEQRLEVPLVALPARTQGGAGDTHVRVLRKGDEEQVSVDVAAALPAPATVDAYLADLAGFDAPLDAVVLHWREDAAFEARLAISVSDDLEHWRAVLPQATALALGQGKARIVRQRFALGGVRARYLRVAWLGTVPDSGLARVTLIHREAAESPQRQWIGLRGERHGDAIRYLSEGVYPVDRLRLAPAGGSDVLPATVLSRPLVSARWQWRARTLGYRLEAADGIIESPPDAIPLTRDVLWQVAPEQATGWAAAPVLHLGWVPDQVVFVARGAPPFTLAVGREQAEPRWLPIRSVVPRKGPGAVLPAPARVLPGSLPLAPAPRALAPWQAGRHWLLWAVLASGVAVLALMARGVWRGLKEDAATAKPAHDQASSTSADKA